MTYTAAAVHVDGRAEVLGLGNRAMQVPSVVFVREDGGVVVGEAAEQQGIADPDRLVREFKRRIGDPVPLVVGGSPFSAQALTARLLARVVEVATERRGGPPEHVTVTHPANWGPFKRDLLGQAIELAGLRGAGNSTCTEPEAAAIAYASRDRVGSGDRVAVYDLGGGTFDAAVLVRADAGFRLAGPPEGVEHLGGVDFDEAVFRHVLAALGDDVVAGLDDPDPATLAGLARLRRDCVEAKEVLSSDVDTAVRVALPGIDRSVRLTRGELDDMLRPAIAETVAAMARALEAAGTAPGDLSAIVMVGGSSRIPLVSQMVSQAFERPLAMDNHPKHDVALGAALRSAPAARSSAPRPPAPPVQDAPTIAVAVDPDATAVVRTGATRSSEPSPGRPPVPRVPLTPGPPEAPDVAATARPPRRRGPVLLVAALLAAVAMVTAISVILDPPWAELVHREARDAEGAFPPFVPSPGDPGQAGVPVPEVKNLAVSGDMPGLYGGTRSNACDAGAIRTHLEADPAKAVAWATALGTEPSGIGPLLTSLTPLTLRTDTAVTNHGFASGRPTPFQSVLQAGTAVLVDPLGLPRVRCYCGNPLAEPDRQSAIRYTDPTWAGFADESVTVITRAPTEVRDFVVVRSDTDEVVTRPRGTDGGQDRTADPVLAAKVADAFVTGAADAATPTPDPATVLPVVPGPPLADAVVPPAGTSEAVSPGTGTDTALVTTTEPDVTTEPEAVVTEPVPDPGTAPQDENENRGHVEPYPQEETVTDPPPATEEPVYDSVQPAVIDAEG